MEKKYSEIVGMPILTEDNPRPIARVFDLIIDPENGSLLALSAGRKILSVMDIIRFSRYVLIHDADDFCRPEDIFRVKEVLKSGIKIIKNKVFTENGKYLGKVFDYSIHTKLSCLKKLFVAKTVFLVFRFDTRIISAKHILEIKANKITVKDDFGKIPVEEHEEEVKMEEELSSV